MTVTKTTELQLSKPDGDEYVDIGVINSNMDTIDSAISTGAVKSKTFTFGSTTLQTLLKIAQSDLASADYEGHTRLRITCTSTTNASARHIMIVDVLYCRGNAEWRILNNLQSANENSGIYQLQWYQPNATYYATTSIDAKYRSCYLVAKTYSATAKVIKIEVMESSIPVTFMDLSAYSTVWNSTYMGNLSYNVGQYNNHVESNSIACNITGTSDGTYTIYDDYWGLSGEAQTNGYITAKSTDGKAYKLTGRTDKAFCLPLTMARLNNAPAVNGNVSIRTKNRNLSISTSLNGMSAVSTAIGAPLYIRGSLDSNGNFICDGKYSSVMASGYTWIQIGTFGRTTSSWNMDSNQIFTAVTLDSDGKVTHVNGKAISSSPVTTPRKYVNNVAILTDGSTGTLELLQVGINSSGKKYGYLSVTVGCNSASSSTDFSYMNLSTLGTGLGVTFVTPSSAYYTGMWYIINSGYYKVTASDNWGNQLEINTSGNVCLGRWYTKSAFGGWPRNQFSSCTVELKNMYVEWS